MSEVLYCSICGDYLFHFQGSSIKSAPIRPLDSSFVIDEDLIQIKNTLIEGVTLVVKRENGGFVKQERLNCSSCGVTVAYHQGGKFLYIFANAVVECFKQP